MKPETLNQEQTVKHDEDVVFEVEKEALIAPLPESPGTGVGETTLPAKEDTLGKSDFKPLTEQEKQPKLSEDS